MGKKEEKKEAETNEERERVIEEREILIKSPQVGMMLSKLE